jgi:hypothetical protein
VCRSAIESWQLSYRLRKLGSSGKSLGLKNSSWTAMQHNPVG